MERCTEQSNITRAFAVHARTLELLDARGLGDDLVPHGMPVRRLVPTPGTMLDLDEFETRYHMVLIAPQSGTEHLLEARARQLGVPIDYGCNVVGLRQDGEGVVLDVEKDGVTRQRSAAYAAGCDGSHSGIRRMGGVDFVGKQYETHILLADVMLAAPPAEAMFTRNNTFNRMMAGHSRPMRLLQRLVISSVLRLRRPRLAVGGRLTGLGIAYPPRERGQHPWTGRRMPDVRCTDGRLYELLRDGRFVPVTATRARDGEQVGAPWSDRVRSAPCAPGSVPGLPASVLVRPDGYVAWASGNPTDREIERAISDWCGRAALNTQIRPAARATTTASCREATPSLR